MKKAETPWRHLSQGHLHPHPQILKQLRARRLFGERPKLTKRKRQGENRECQKKSVTFLLFSNITVWKTIHFVQAIDAYKPKVISVTSICTKCSFCQNGNFLAVFILEFLDSLCLIQGSN